MNEYKKGDVVQIHNGDIKFPGLVTDVTPRFLFVGKLKFRRDNGQMVKRQKERVYRLNLCIKETHSIPDFSSDSMADAEVCVDSTGRAYSAVRRTTVSEPSKWLPVTEAEASRVSRRDSINPNPRSGVPIPTRPVTARAGNDPGTTQYPQRELGHPEGSHGDKGDGCPMKTKVML